MPQMLTREFGLQPLLSRPILYGIVYGQGLQKPAELLRTQSRIAHDPLQGQGVDRVLARNGEYAHSVGHNHVCALAQNPEPRLLQHCDGDAIIYPGNFRRILSSEFTDTNERKPEKRPHTHGGEPRLELTHFFGCVHVFRDGELNIRERLLFRCSLRPATGKLGA